jgi:hypothetical protein
MKFSIVVIERGLGLWNRRKFQREFGTETPKN